MRTAASVPGKADVTASEVQTVPPAPPGGEREMVPLSALNHYLFCPRRAALIHVEGIFEDNQHTLRGNIVHEHADLPGYEVAKGVTLLRALPVFSERLGLSGKCDIVEQHPGGSLFPVEFKLGKRRQFENDDVQLCAQTICLEEMFHLKIPCGAIFHAQSKRRREVEFSADLRLRTEQAVAELHSLLKAESIPAARYIEDRCEECSLFNICLPRVTSQPPSLRRAAERLFEV
jgi:CRISPR-associated exonuclease Cas4